MFLQHVRVHSPDKPRTVRRYATVLEHVSRILGRKPVDAIQRADIDDYKNARSREVSKQHKDRPITPRTINYEISVLRTFFYFLIRERNLAIENPCSNFKQLKDLVFPVRLPWSAGLLVCLSQDHVFRNHRVGKTWRTAASSPRLATVIRMTVSSGPAFKYSTKTSK
jgi:hypothetical protein